MVDVVQFYKHDIPSWMDGTEALSDGAYRAYHVICQLIYLNEGPITLNERGLAGRCNQSARGFRKFLAELIGAGKLSLDEDGRLDNVRAEAELDKVYGNRRNASEGGKKSKFKRENSKLELENSETNDEPPKPNDEKSDTDQNRAHNPLKNNNAGEASLFDDVSLKEKRREEKTPLTPQAGGQSDPDPPEPGEAPDEQTAFEMWNELAVRRKLPTASVLNASRRRGLSGRLREGGGLDGWRKALTMVEQSRWCLGQGKDGRKATIDFIIQSSTFVKLMDGGYSDEQMAFTLRSQNGNDDDAIHKMALDALGAR